MSDLPIPREQGDATKCRCGRTEFFPKNCPCQDLPPRGTTDTERSKRPRPDYDPKTDWPERYTDRWVI